MDYNFNEILGYAKRMCEGRAYSYNAFYRIYSFTTENIDGYIDNFNLENKSLMTVGSSGDQIINAISNGGEDITLVDINPFVKYYYYLKVAGILELDLNLFLEFFRYVDYPGVFKYNNGVFNSVIYNKLKNTLGMLDYESYLFWDKLFYMFDPVDIRSRLFSTDENKTDVIIGCNNYLQSKDNYYDIRNKVGSIRPKFIINDIFTFNSDKKYDNVWLSNIVTYLSYEEIKMLIDKVDCLVNHGGSLLVGYLYQTERDTKYNSNWASVYNLDETLKVLGKYKLDLISFLGTKGILFSNEAIKDSILIRKNKECN